MRKLIKNILNESENHLRPIQIGDLYKIEKSSILARIEEIECGFPSGVKDVQSALGRVRYEYNGCKLKYKISYDNGETWKYEEEEEGHWVDVEWIQHIENEGFWVLIHGSVDTQGFFDQLNESQDSIEIKIGNIYKNVDNGRLLKVSRVECEGDVGVHEMDTRKWGVMNINHDGCYLHFSMTEDFGETWKENGNRIEREWIKFLLREGMWELYHEDTDFFAQLNESDEDDFSWVQDIEQDYESMFYDRAWHIDLDGSTEQHQEAQKFLFSIGFQWGSGGTRIKTYNGYISIECVFRDNVEERSITHSDTWDYQRSVQQAGEEGLGDVLRINWSEFRKHLNPEN